MPKKQVLLELGGNAPCLIDRDVDWRTELCRLSESAWANAGQVCIKAQRFFVHQDIFDEFLPAFVAESQTIEVGDPIVDKTMVGPLIESKQVERVLRWIRDAEAAGAVLLSGGRSDGQLVWPTVLTQTRNGMLVRDAEVFGPVTVVERVESFEHAIEQANCGRFGLQASVFTKDLSNALIAFERLEFGSVLINDATTFRVDNYPYGGTKDSGFGREGVRSAMEEYSEARVLSLRAS